MDKKYDFSKFARDAVPDRDWIRKVGKAAEEYEGSDEMDGRDLAYSLFTAGVINEKMSISQAAQIVAQHFVQQ